MRKIALLSDYLSGAGGTEYYTAMLAKSLREHGNDVRVYTGSEPQTNYWLDFLANNGVSTFSSGLPRGDRLDRAPEASTVATMAKDRQWQPDIVHANPLGKMAVEWILANRDGGPFVATEWTVPSQRNRHWYQGETADLINEVDAMIVTCEASARGLRQEFGYQGRCETIPHLIEPPKIVPRAIGHSAIKSVACVARLAPEKGQDLLLAAFSRVIEEHPELTLQFFGDGRDRAHLEDAVQSYGLVDSTQFHGEYRPLGGIDHIAATHSIFVQPSLFESIPTTVLELAARRRSSIATNVGGIAEFIQSGHNGILVPPADSQAIACAINSYYEDPALLSQHQEAARLSFLSRYNNARNLARIMALYEQIN